MVADPEITGAEGQLASKTIGTCVGDTKATRAEPIAHKFRDVKCELNGRIYRSQSVRVSKSHGPQHVGSEVLVEIAEHTGIGRKVHAVSPSWSLPGRKRDQAE